MQDEQKQIEEMAQSIVNREKNYVCGETTCSMYSDITYDCFSLYEAGYRKQSDTAREILQYLYEKMGNVSLSDTELVLSLATQYGLETRRQASRVVVRLYILLNFMKKVIRSNVDKNQNL